MNRISGQALKWILYGVEIWLVYVVQSTPLLLPAFFGERPMLVTVCAVSIALFEGDVTGMWFGLGAGLLLDVGSTIPFGFYGLVHLALCFGCGTLVMYLMRNNLATSLILGFGAVVLAAGAQWLFFAQAGMNTAGFFLLHILLPRAVYSTLTMPLFYYLNRAVTTRLYDD